MQYYNQMNEERFDFRIGNFQVVQLHTQRKGIKRNFKGVKEGSTKKKFRVITYNIEFVEKEKLLQHLHIIKDITHPSLGKITHIVEQTSIVDEHQYSQTENVIAVILEETTQTQYIPSYEFITQVGPLTQILTQTFTLKVLELIRLFKQKNIWNYFYPEQINIDKKTGEITIDCYGDQKYFKLQEDYVSDFWELGFFVVFCLKGIPPYIHKSHTDTFYKLLRKGSFMKFWNQFQKRPRKLQLETIEFINFLFSEKQDPSLDINDRYWLKTAKQMKIEETMIEIKQILQQKQDLKVEKQKNRQKKQQSIKNALLMKNSQLQKRGSQENEFIQTFLEKFENEETIQRKFKAESKIAFSDILLNFDEVDAQFGIAYILTLLSANTDQNVQILYLKQQENNILKLRVKTEIGQIYFLDNQIVLQLIKENNNVGIRVKKIEGSVFECQWIHNYLRQLITIA